MTYYSLDDPMSDIIDYLKISEIKSILDTDERDDTW